MHTLSLLVALSAFVFSMPVQQAPAVELVGPAASQKVMLAELASLPRTSVTVDDHGSKATFEGVELRHLLAKVGAPLGDKLRGKELAHYVIAEAADGYRVVFALAELDAGFTDARVILADQRNGKPIAGDEGPLRLIVEKEKRMGRSARQVTRLLLAVAR
jgi:hypothetical protein